MCLVLEIHIIYRTSRSPHRQIERKHCALMRLSYIKCGLSASRARCMMHRVGFHLVIYGFITGSLYDGGDAYRIAVLRYERGSSFLREELHLSRR